MIRSVLRTLLRRQLMEATADAWADADLNTLLDAGCDLVGARFFAMAPDRAPVVTTLNGFQAVAGYTFASIALPASFSRMQDVSLLVSGAYVQIPKRPREEVEGKVSGDDAGWCYLGATVLVGPAPSVNLANGVRFRHNGGISLAADGDSPPFPPSLHLAIMYEAKGIALGETGEDDTPTQRMLTRLYGTFAAEYLDGGGEPEIFNLDRGSSTQY